MDYKKLVKALLCDGSGVDEDINGCTNKKCKYRDGDGGCNLVRMCGDAAIAITGLLARAESAESRAEKAEKERDAAIKHSRGNCFACKHHRELYDGENCIDCKWNGLYGDLLRDQDDWEWRGLEDE